MIIIYGLPDIIYQKLFLSSSKVRIFAQITLKAKEIFKLFEYITREKN